MENLNLQHSEQAGLLVLSPRVISSLQRPHAFERHRILVELIQSLSFLGVNQYVLAVTHLYQVRDPKLWFMRATNACAERLKEWFRINVTHPAVPILPGSDSGESLSSSAHWVNLQDATGLSDMLPGYEGPTLVSALEDLVGELSQGKWWITANVVSGQDDQECLLVERHVARGRSRGPEDALIYDGQEEPVKAKLRPHDLGYMAILDGSRELRRDREVVVTELDTTNTKEDKARVRRAWKAIGVELLPIRSETDLGGFRDLLNEAEVTLFGEQRFRAESIEEEEAPLTVEKHDTGPADQLEAPNDVRATLSRASRAILSLRHRHLMVSFDTDRDAGRLLLRYRRPDGSMAPFAVGKVVASLEPKRGFLTSSFLELDRLRILSNGNQDLLFNEFSAALHKLKNQWPDLPVFSSGDERPPAERKGEVWHQCLDNCRKPAADFRVAMRELRRAIERALEIPMADANAEEDSIDKSIRGAAHSLEKFTDDFQDSVQAIQNALEARTATLEQLNAKYPFFRGLRTMCADVNASLGDPVVRAVCMMAEGIKSDPEWSQWSVEVVPAGGGLGRDYKTSQEVVTYYPLRYKAVSHVKKNLETLLSNVRQHAYKHGTQADIFLDLPAYHEAPMLAIWVQDRSILDDEVLSRMTPFSQGLGNVSRSSLRLVLPEDDFSGLNTVVGMRVPVWLYRHNRLKPTIEELASLLNLIDYRCKTSGAHFYCLFAQVLDIFDAQNFSRHVFAKLEKEAVAACEALGSRLARYKAFVAMLSQALSDMASPAREAEWQNAWEDLSALARCPLTWLGAESTTDGAGSYILENIHLARRVKDAIEWTKNRIVDGPVSILAEYQNRGERDFGVIKILEKDMNGWHPQLVPLQTRLTLLGVKSAYGPHGDGAFTFEIPLWRC